MEQQEAELIFRQAIDKLAARHRCLADINFSNCSIEFIGSPDDKISLGDEAETLLQKDFNQLIEFLQQDTSDNDIGYYTKRACACRQKCH